MEWDEYVQNHPLSTPYHLYGWKSVIEKTYGHHTYYLMAKRGLVNSAAYNGQTACGNQSSAPRRVVNTVFPVKRKLSVVGILPLVHFDNVLFGKSIVSMPFFDQGGILADDIDAEEALLSEAIRLAQDLRVKTIELRQPATIFSLENGMDYKVAGPLSAAEKWVCRIRSHKVRMILALPNSSEKLMQSFKSKLRNKIKIPIREGLSAKVGGNELLHDFYTVFITNMRDLGSPVHSKRLFQTMLDVFPFSCKLVVVYQGNTALAGGVIFGFKNTLANPWASSLRSHGNVRPNKLLYWTMLEYGCMNSFQFFDFGRSSPGDGTYAFKQQWGANPIAIQWHFLTPARDGFENTGFETSKFSKAITYWQKLPVSITAILGPLIRKHISL
ncbi:MAG: GNAT family N-acetyltransferase [Smithellaceae bacterium]